jgi:hypothetical protein
MDVDPRDHQKLVVNPFLAVLTLIVIVHAGNWLLNSSYAPLLMMMVAPIVLLPQLIQYHCLDCGTTGRYPRRNRHACPTIVSRWENHQSTDFPSPRGQLIAWGWLIGSVAFVVLFAWE